MSSSLTVKIEKMADLAGRAGELLQALLVARVGDGQAAHGENWLGMFLLT